MSGRPPNSTAGKRSPDTGDTSHANVYVTDSPAFAEKAINFMMRLLDLVRQPNAFVAPFIDLTEPRLAFATNVSDILAEHRISAIPGVNFS